MLQVNMIMYGKVDHRFTGQVGVFEGTCHMVIYPTCSLTSWNIQQHKRAQQPPYRQTPSILWILYGPPGEMLLLMQFVFMLEEFWWSELHALMVGAPNAVDSTAIVVFFCSFCFLIM